MNYYYRNKRNLVLMVNLSRLEGAKEIVYNNEEGIFIPINRNNLFSGRFGIYIKLLMLDNMDNYGNRFRVANSLSPKERKHNSALKFIGHGNFEGSGIREVIDIIHPDDNDDDNDDKGDFIPDMT